eukprot:365754-Chlamydomonas_euryale.AAC.3
MIYHDEATDCFQPQTASTTVGAGYLPLPLPATTLIATSHAVGRSWTQSHVPGRRLDAHRFPLLDDLCRRAGDSLDAHARSGGPQSVVACAGACTCVCGGGASRRSWPAQARARCACGGGARDSWGSGLGVAARPHGQQPTAW